MSENKRKICVWVPDDLYNNVIKVGFSGPTSAVIQGLELLWTEKQGELKFKNKWNQETSGESYEAFVNLLKESMYNLSNNSIADHTDLLAENTKLKNEVERLTEALQKAPDPVELAELRANLTDLERLLEEKDKRIEDLTKAIDMLNVFANYFQTVSQNK
jgi:tetratricopeptide (TPR) repeat protein